MRLLTDDSDDEVVAGGAGPAPRFSPTLHFSVVVCCYTERRWALIEQCVQSLADQTLAPFEVVLVVDHNPQLAARAKRRFPWVAVVSNDGPQGLSGARNSGVAVARGDVVAFLDDDALAARDWLERLAVGYRDPAVLGVGGMVTPRWEGGRPDWLPPELDWTVGCSYKGLPETVSSVRNFIGANMSFRRSVLEEAGAFSYELGRQGSVPLGCEETELCIRVTDSHGPGSLLYDPAAEVHHHVPAERASWGYVAARCRAEGRCKAVVARLSSRGGAALETERRYVLRVLPSGALQALVDGAFNPRRALAAGVIAAGFALTGAAYLNARLPLFSILSRGLSRAAAALHMGAVIAALALWGVSVAQLRPGHMDDWGLVSVLPGVYWAALAVLTLSAGALLVRRRPPEALMVAHLVSLVLVLFATTTVAYPELRYSWAWKHVGVVNYMMTHHSIGHGQGLFTAYHGWPGFFALSAVLTGGSHLGSALSYAAWAPPVFELADLAPLFLIFKHFSDDRRITWSAMWLYLLGNWIGQDYFSPQAMSLFLYLCAIALALRWLPEVGVPGRVVMRADHRVVVLPRLGVPGRRVALGLAMVLAVAMVSAHQLTPYMLVAALVGLALVRSRRTGMLAAFTAVAAIAWAATAGRYFLVQNAGWVFRSVGSFLTNASPRAGGFVATPVAAQQVVDRLAEGLGAAICVLAVIGALRRRRWHADRGLLVLGVTPLPLLAANAYGGEMVLRCYLFALPTLAFFAAAAFFPSPNAGTGWRIRPSLTVSMGVLLVAFTFAYNGAERTNYFTPAELSATTWIYHHAPAGSLVWGPDDNLPWGFEDTERLDYQWLNYTSAATVDRTAANPAGVLARTFSHSPERDQFVVLTRSQATIEILGDLPAGMVVHLEKALSASPAFATVYRNPDAVIFRYVGGKLA